MSASEPLTLELEAGTRSVTARAAIAGLGSALPAQVVPNASIASVIGVDDEWIERRTGIRSRRRVGAGDSLVGLAVASARAALADAGLDGGELDLVLLATISQESSMPNLAPQVASGIGAHHAGAFDVGAACSGFLMGLATGASFIEAGRARNVLVVGAEVLSRQTDPHDRRTAALFGDGAGAVVLGRADGGGGCGGCGGGISAIELGCDGTLSQLIVTDPDSGLIRMDGHETFKQAVACMERASRAICANAGVDLSDEVELFVFHQANARITRALTERLGVAEAKVIDCIAELGNTSSATVPLALEHARADGRLRAGSRVLVCTVGSGFIWGAMLLEWGRG